MAGLWEPQQSVVSVIDGERSPFVTTKTAVEVLWHVRTSAQDHRFATLCDAFCDAISGDLADVPLEGDIWGRTTLYKKVVTKDKALRKSKDTLQKNRKLLLDASGQVRHTRPAPR